MSSLRTRLLAAATVVLTVFVGVTGAALIEANQERALLAQEDRMQGLVYSLLGAADVGPAGEIVLPEGALTEPRLLNPASGLEARIFDDRNTQVWRSPSALAIPVSPTPLPVGQARFTTPATREEQFRLDYAVLWYGEGDTPFRFTFQVSEAAEGFFLSEAGFARRLWLWLLVPAGILVLAQLAVLSWALRPLRRMEAEVNALEEGIKDRLDPGYPAELEPLQRALNALLAAEQDRRQRYSDALGDLSHSLKTPLAAARTLLANPALDRIAVGEHLDRMDRIIRYHLGRAVARAAGALKAPQPVAPVIRRLGGTLAKVHVAKHLKLAYAFAADCHARIDEDALFELLGNLFDNACKWARHEVCIALVCDGDNTFVTIDDDGPGFPDEDLSHWLERGARADQRQDGQGFGLSVAYDILRSVGGGLELARSPAGGARVRVRLPG